MKEAAAKSVWAASEATKRGGMPLWKRVANRFLTAVENHTATAEHALRRLYPLAGAAHLTLDCAAVERMFAAAAAKFGRVDCVIANAGRWTPEFALVHQASEARIRDVLRDFVDDSKVKLWRSAT